MTNASIIEFRSTNTMREGHALTVLPEGAEPGGRETQEHPQDQFLDWYLVRCAGRREHRAEAALVASGIAVYLPRGVRKKRQGPHRIRVEEALFKGYLFAGVKRGSKTIGDIETADATVYRVVRFQNAIEPRPIDWRVISEILTLELAGTFAPGQRKDPPVGAEVRITGGMFQGYPAIFVRRRPDERIDLLLKMLGKETPHSEPAHNIAGFDAEDAEAA